MNIVVICADTFRYDHLGFLKLQPVLTPNLDNFASQSACFTDFQLCSFPTILNRIEVFTGRCAFPRFGWGALPYEYPVLSEIFERQGFRTALISDNVQVTKSSYNFRRGFGHYGHVRGQQHDDFLPEDHPMVDLPCPVKKLDASPKRLARYQRNACWYRKQGTNATESVFKEAMVWLKGQSGGNFFLWLDSFDPHEPWDAPRKYLEKYPWDPNGAEVIWPHSGRASQFYSEADLANMRSLYRAEVTQTDFWIGEFLQTLKNEGRLEDTTVLFCSDHGHYFGEHNMIGKFMKPGMDRPTTIYEEVGHIPLLIRRPDGLGAGQQIGGLCQPQDLMPTLLELAGIPGVPWAEGASLVPRLHGSKPGQEFAVGGSHPHRRGITCLTVWTERWCYVYSPLTGMAGAELFERKSDPFQQTNVLASNQEVGEQHFQLLLKWFSDLKVPLARQRQLMHNEDFGWSDRMKYKGWKLGKRLTYFAKYRNYARSGH
ncbi:MAG TPA: sulfatase [Candidatus Saccharimonadales bacterium]|nr:sulfatase [Candidatus Saccharimonadales bacterium]